MRLAPAAALLVPFQRDSTKRAAASGPRGRPRRASDHWAQIVGTALALAVAPPAPLLSQRDSGAAAVLDTVLVTAERVPTALDAVSAAVTRIGAARLASVPHATFADLLRLAPGFALVDFDGLGRDPQLMVRGFYGGGEAEYVVVLIDGTPLNQLHTGLVAWDALPALDGIEAVEIVRGSSSALYGDAAVGAVINVITRPAGTRRSPRWSLSGGTHGSWRASADLAGVVLRRAVSVSGGMDRTDGFRTHARRTAGRVRVGVPLVARAATDLTLSARAHRRDFDEPGALLDSLLAVRREGSDPLFRFDHTRDRDYAVGLNGGHRLGARTRLAGAVTVENRRVNAVRTLALAPGFGDTKERETANGRASGGVLLEIGDTPLPGPDQLSVGTDLTRGSSDSRYYAVFTGDRDAYSAADGRRDSLESAGDAARNAAGLFAQYSVQPAAAVRVSLGGRFDWLTDDFEPGSVSGGAAVRASHRAFSPKAGVNVRYQQSERASGNVYVTVSRSFKAPTLDQLFDQRLFSFPPYVFSIANAQLVPQSGTSVEAGLYHHASLGGAARLDATLSAYRMDMKDEIDFDVQTLRYVNIGRSRHRGVEAGLVVSGSRIASAFVSYTLQAVTARSGAFAGNALKAIPKHAWTAGLAVTTRPADARLLLYHARDMYLDDANTVRLPAYTRVDLQLAYPWRTVEILLDATNLLGARYSTTGFLDPAGTGRAYFHPAAGRVLRLGIRGGP